jgi:4-amino-4-deoxy-L-arabinose transferase-like glycosyltransferase
MKKLSAILSTPSVRDRILLVAFGMLLFLPALGSVHLFDWDEINFAEAAREMIATGNYMRVQIDFKPFWEKPPLFFWLQALSMHAWGINEFAARFVDAVAGLLTMLAVYGVGSKLHGRRFGLLWALGFCGSLLPHVLFKSGVIDPWFNLFIFLGVYFLTRTTIASGPGRLRLFAAAGALIGLAVLTKGPVAFMLAVLAWGVYWLSVRLRRIASVKDGLVFTAAAAGVALLFYGTETLWHGTWFMQEFIKYHLRLLGTSEAGHGEPIYYHFFVLLFGCFPVSILALRGFRLKAGEDAGRADFSRWMAVLFGVVFTVFSIVKTKTALYSSLCYYPLTYFAALHLTALLEGRISWQRRWSWLLLAIGVPLGLVMIALPQLMLHKETIMPLITDRFSVACLARPVAWSGWESLAGALWLAVVVAAVVLLGLRRLRTAVYTLLIGGAFGIQALMLAVTGKIEDHSQGAPIAFYRSVANEDCYVKPLFKTYAHLFYAAKRPPTNPQADSRDWLLTGDIDKPVYIIDRNYHGRETAAKYGLTIVKEDGGFVFMRREVPGARMRAEPFPQVGAAPEQPASY